MKKLFSLLVVAGMISLVACGPSAEEKAAAEKARQDSINAVVEQMVADSMAAAQAYQDSVNQAMEKLRVDSIAAAAAAKKTVAKPKPKPAPAPAPETPKVGTKKPGAK